MLGAILGPGARMLDAPPDPCLSTAHHACASEGLSRKRGGAAPSSMRVGRGGGEQIYSMSRGGRPGPSAPSRPGAGTHVKRQRCGDPIRS